MKLTVKEARRICREHNLERRHIRRMNLREGMTLDGLLILINHIARHREICASGKAAA
jgi:hypothetical protein